MDFDACFELLAARPAHAHDHCEQVAHNTSSEKDVQSLSDALESQLGQTIDNSNAETALKTTDVSDVVTQGDTPSLASLSVRALAQAFFRLQEARVQIYSDFHKGFAEHQQTEFFTSFSSGITARFAAVSNTINSVEQTLVAKHQRMLAQCIRHVQLQEKEKLMITSALLVEQMRLRDALRQSSSEEQEAVGHASIASLLEQSVASLQRKLAANVERINELLDDLRTEVVDLEEVDDDDAGISKYPAH